MISLLSWENAKTPSFLIWVAAVSTQFSPQHYIVR